MKNIFLMLLSAIAFLQSCTNQKLKFLKLKPKNLWEKQYMISK